MPLADLGGRAIGRAPSDECSGCMAGAREKPRAQLYQQARVYNGSRTAVWFALALAIERSLLPGRRETNRQMVENSHAYKGDVFARTKWST